jgi:hypothetical protein
MLAGNVGDGNFPVVTKPVPKKHSAPCSAPNRTPTPAPPLLQRHGQPPGDQSPRPLPPCRRGVSSALIDCIDCIASPDFAGKRKSSPGPSYKSAFILSIQLQVALFSKSEVAFSDKMNTVRRPCWIPFC